MGAQASDQGGNSGSLQGPFADRSGHSEDGGVFTDVFTVFMYAPEASELDAFEWLGPCSYEGAVAELPDTTVGFAGSGASTTMTVEYLASMSTGTINFACLVNGVPYVGNVNIGSDFGA